MNLKQFIFFGYLMFALVVFGWFGTAAVKGWTMEDLGLSGGGSAGGASGGYYGRSYGGSWGGGK